MSFLANFTNLCIHVGKSPTAVCKEIGLSNATYSAWRKRDTVPSEKTLLKISNYFGVSKEHLLSDDVMKYINIPFYKSRNWGRKKRIAVKDLSERDLLQLYRKVSPQAKSLVLDYLVKSAEIEVAATAPVEKIVADAAKSSVVAAEARPVARGELQNKTTGGIKVKVKSGGKK